MITFTPLSGAAGTVRTVPLAYLLQVDDVRILLDCGSPDWCPEPSSEEGDDVLSWTKYCDALKECAPSVDLVLLSHGDLSHSGLYPYAYSHWGLTAPAYTTLPIQAMAKTAATEDVEAIRDEQPVEDIAPPSEESLAPEGSVSPSPNNATPPASSPTPSPSSRAVKHRYVATVQQVHDAFDSVNVLRYSQPCHLQGKCQGLTIIPFNAGHTLGGTIWKIRSPSAGTILYAVDMNHMRERHLDGTVLIRQGSTGGVFESLARPDLLITDAERANVTTARRKDRDSALLDCVTATLSSRNSLLLPCDSSTRVLELLVLLDQHWNYSRLKYPICLLSRTGREMLTFVRSMMEWLGGTISKEDVGEDGTNHGRDRRRRDEDNDEEALGAFALRFRHLEFFSSPQALMSTYSTKDPKLILAVPATLSHGPSRSLFAHFAEIPDNVVLLTGRSEPGTLGRILFDKWNNSQREEAKWDRGKIGNNIMMDGVLRLEIHKKVPLQGDELEEFLAKERAVKEKEAAHQAALARTQRMLEADEGQSDSDSDDEDESDDDEEDEVERELGEDLMDATDDLKRSRQGPNATTRSGTKRKRGEGGGGDGTDWVLGNEADEGATRISFDIYLKGNVAKATSFFKSADGQTQRFRMFPYVEKKRKVDEYGETVDVGTWLRKGKVLEEDAEDEETKDARRRKEEEEAKKAPQEPPSKFVTSIAEVQLACRLFFVDLEGLNDGRAVKTIVPQVNPRKMILIHAPQAATDALIESCANIRAMTKEIYAPAQGETVQIGQQTNSFSISLSDELLASIKMSRFEDNEVGYVAGRIASLATSMIPVLQPASSASLQTQAASLQPVQVRMLGSRPKQPLPQSTMIGELKLTSLKARLAQVGVQAELVGEGVLICGAAAKKGASADALEDSVAVRKTGRGRVELEGSISDIYYKVRKEIYALHALVAA
ncbi:uncharacterized protein TRAVEDRAFT_162694 [Trametes versicolor FP-101664 SS1]|uniref:uncharacterized protein n=1 Tax=Trametes versicolor (strain FP-101664) TaxID=717944 RepID=UPI0004622F77|nr:uncharacterized protein TRAVEDRAFT_162694 [Trametes versicolor FP-101664 SS1]EIW61467.1 hypothetical protein TRAVEDRAFT_162694 [Trametes versicolor FP-101664 SS1]